MTSKVQSHHLQKPAYIYVRQSTMGQVRHHHESTERQYGLRNRAVEMMWAPERIRILDQDLGQSGAQTTTREDFKTLVADVSLGRVGAIFALEASRLARSNLEWHRLIEICGLTRTLVVDEDGCYDPADFNDALLLGLKATLAHAELHVIRARLQGGKLHKARKGELRFLLPIGLCYADEGRIVLDPDQEVQGAVRLVFDVFRQTGSAYAVVHYFGRQQLRFPKRAYGGAWDGRLIWGRLNHGRVLDILKNPSYAGAYVFGRHQSTKEVSSAGDVRTRKRRVPLDDWLVRIQNHHDGYVSWPEYERNQQLLENNRTNAEHMLLSGAAREGLALLQSLLLCGRCGRRLTVRYKGNGGIYATYECNARRREGVAASRCMSLRCDLLDTAVSGRVLAVLQPAQLEVAAEALRQLEHRDTAMSSQWRMRLERVEYEAQLAQRRYEEVDPSNRLVAATLEQRWNDALVRLEEIRTQFADFQSREALVVTPEQRAKVAALAHDFPRLWNAPTTKTQDKKRILRLVVKDITVERFGERKRAVLHVRWQGGACEDLEVTLPENIADRLRYPDELIDRVRELARERSDEDVAATLNGEGRRSAKGEAFNVSMVRWIRYKHRIPAPAFQRPGERSVSQVADELGVSRSVVYYWIDRGVLTARRCNHGSRYWITLNDETKETLRAWIRNSSRI
ncbi:MAG: recombinase family protein [Acidobacteria bacterium]|nr:recombinase family protein [Acidobacteriota bacterium]